MVCPFYQIQHFWLLTLGSIFARMLRYNFPDLSRDGRTCDDKVISLIYGKMPFLYSKAATQNRSYSWRISGPIELLSFPTPWS